MLQLKFSSAPLLLVTFCDYGSPITVMAQRQMERLDRGLVAVHASNGDVFVSWRLLGTDRADVAFNLYRQSEGAAAERLNDQPLTGGTNYLDQAAERSGSQSYFVRTVIGGGEGEPSTAFPLPAGSPVRPYLSIPLQTPQGYRSNDGSVADLTGDGRYEIVNFAIWWDGDLLRELLDRNTISKWDWENEREVRLLTAEGCESNNGSKATPVLCADILGDWREEVIWRTADSRELRLYTTPHPTSHRIHTLMHDPVYRLSVAWQNAGYNQPPHPGFFLGHDMPSPPSPQIRVVTPADKVRQPQTQAAAAEAH